MGPVVLSWGQTEGIREATSFYPDLCIQSEPWLWHKPNNSHSALDRSVLIEDNLPALNHWGLQKMKGGRGVKGGQNMDSNESREKKKCEKWDKRPFSSFGKKGPEDRICHYFRLLLRKENNPCVQLNINQHRVHCATVSQGRVWSAAWLQGSIRSILLSS